MSHADALVDDIANELDTWPGVTIERISPARAVVRYDTLALGILDAERGLAHVLVSPPEYDELIEHGDAEPDQPVGGHDAVSHAVEGATDVTEVLDLFDSRYRDIRGEDEPYSSSD